MLDCWKAEARQALEIHRVYRGPSSLAGSRTRPTALISGSTCREWLSKGFQRG